MENVKFICRRKGRFFDITEYVFKISEHIASLIREYTGYPKDQLEAELTSENEFIFRVQVKGKDDKPSEIDESAVIIEKISNNMDESVFWNHLLTKNGYRMAPVEIHNIIENEFQITDNHEWWVAHFYIGLSRLLYSPY